MYVEHDADTQFGEWLLFGLFVTGKDTFQKSMARRKVIFGSKISSFSFYFVVDTL